MTMTQVKPEICLHIEEETSPVRGQFCSGDAEFDKALEDEILARLNREDTWAWCTVKVTATFKGLSGVDYLGCCCYKDEAEFRRDGYFSDMVHEACTELSRNLAELQGFAIDVEGTVKRETEPKPKP